MKQIFTLLAILTSLFILTYCTGQSERDSDQPAEKAELTEQELIEKGEYLVTIAGCHDCHSPKRMNAQGMPEIIEESMLGGYPADREIMDADKGALRKNWLLMNLDVTQFAGPWGMSFAANLTSDPTGIGNWTEEQFRKAMKEGKYKGLDNSRMILPPMPWQNFANISDEDLRAIFTYLKNTKPVSNVVPAPIPPDEL